MNLQARVKAILTTPATEWPVIAGEPTDVLSLYRNYIFILAAIPAVCQFLGQVLIGLPFLGRMSPGGALVGAVLTYVVSLVSVYLAAWVIERLAPNFSSSGDTAQALKLVAYASTPVWVAGVLKLIPALGVLVIIAGIYSIYLCYLGMTPVMKTPADKVVVYMIVSALVVIVIQIVLGMVIGSLALTGAMSSYGM
jgi:hypothetical protein